MKYLRFIVSGLLLSTSLLNALASQTLKSCDKLPMAMYIWHGCMTDSDSVNRINFGNFDKVILMDQTAWISQDEFDAKIDSLLAKPTNTIPLTKRDMFKLAVNNAHDSNTLAMISVGNELLYTSLDDERLDKSTDLLCNTVRELDLDGLDIDWETDVWRNFDRHAKLMSTLRKKLDELSTITGKKYNLSTALSIEAKYPDEYRAELAEAVDHINLMSYDIGGCLWRNYASHNTPLNTIAKDVEENWYGIPRNKLYLGLASYGFMYRGIFPDEKVPEGKNIGHYGGYVDYKNMLQYLYGNRAWRRQYDPVEKVYYFLDDKSHSFITMETPETIAMKFDYAVDAGLGGTFWWEYSDDIIPDNDGSPYWRHILVPTHRQISQKSDND